MPTLKSRINLSVSEDMRAVLSRVARREKIPVATAVMQLLRQALELNEDIVLQRVAETRERQRGRFFTHDRAWQ